MDTTYNNSNTGALFASVVDGTRVISGPFQLKSGEKTRATFEEGVLTIGTQWITFATYSRAVIKNKADNGPDFRYIPTLGDLPALVGWFKRHEQYGNYVQLAVDTFVEPEADLEAEFSDF